MRKLILFVSFLAIGGAASASGLYFGVGYGKSDPDLKFDTTTGYSDDESPEYYAGFGDTTTGIQGWPGGRGQSISDALAKELGYFDDTNSNGSWDSGETVYTELWADPWTAGLKEEWAMSSKDSTTYAVAVGWDVPRNPFRFEIEYNRTSAKADRFDMYVYPVYDPDYDFTSAPTPLPDDTTHADWDNIGAVCDAGGNCAPADRYDFDIPLSSSLNYTATTYFANAYFEIPGFGNIDPYVGLGIGQTKISYSGAMGGSTSGKMSNQMMFGVEYRVPDSPFIVGLEYRKFSVSGAEDSVDSYMSAAVDHDYVMFKFRYDPVHGWLDDPAPQQQRQQRSNYGNGYGGGYNNIISSPYYR
ncbi:MAG: porin family protein [Rickettsiales bacterium]|jgi:opacity protein-like surface antigen|nr:porin family protein [Rickettsiales bacterium]